MVIQGLSATRKLLLKRFGAAMLPGVLGDEGVLAVVKLSALPDRYQPPFFNAAHVLPAFKAMLPMLCDMVSDAWVAAARYDAGGYGEGRSLAAAIGALEIHGPLLNAVELGTRLRAIDHRGFELLGVWGKQWVDLVDVAIEAPGSDVGEWLRALPAWHRACHKRRADKRWVRRIMKRERAKLEAHVAWALGLVDANRPWSSEPSIDMVGIDAEWLKRWSGKLTMVRHEDGLAMPLSGLVENAVSNRRAEDYAIAIGLQHLAEREGLHFVLVTYTLPGRYSPKRGKRSSEWNMGSPAAANVELKKRWHRLVTRLVDSVSTCIGFSVTEPQVTGVPHIHCMILTNDPAEVERLVLEYKEDGVHQVDVRRWHMDPKEGKAASIASYLTKYLMKGHMGAPVAADGSPVPVSSGEYDDWQQEQHAFSAWRRGASCRTTSFFGLGRGFKGRWRAVFRARLADKEIASTDSGVLRVAKAMDERDWGTALGMVGGLYEGRPGLSLGVWEPIKEVRENRFEEEVEVVVGYVVRNGTTLMLGTGDWEIVEDDNVEEPEWPDDGPQRPRAQPLEFDKEIDALLKSIGF